MTLCWQLRPTWVCLFDCMVYLAAAAAAVAAVAAAV